MPSYPLPVGPYNDNFSAIQGELVGDAVTHCVWIDADPEGPTTVLWPPGLRVTFDPLRILDSDGNVMALGGEELSIGGSGEPTGGGAAGECAVSERVWHAHHTPSFTFSPAYPLGCAQGPCASPPPE